MQFTMPDMLKQRPKEFWGLLKNKAGATQEISLEMFRKYNEKIFYDEKIPPDKYTPLTNTE